jgi:hypothetical protein
VLAGASFALTLLLPPLDDSFLWLVVVTFLLGFTSEAIDASMNAHAIGIERRWGTLIMSSFHAAVWIFGRARRDNNKEGLRWITEGTE